jgi:two-component system, NarL family, sensor histidine kinase DegS
MAKATDQFRTRAAAEAVDATTVTDGDASLDAELLRQAGTTSALERRLRRLAFDLHDGALQELASLAIELDSARRQILPVVDGEYRERVAGRLDDFHARLLALDDSLRRLVNGINGGSEPIEALDTRVARAVAELRDETGIEAELEITGSFADLTDSRRIAISQIVCEALSNIRQHSAAEHVRVVVVEHEGRVEVSVEDDGEGFDLDDALVSATGRRRFGIVGMVERVRLLGSDLLVDTARGEGTRISFVLDPWDAGTPGGRVHTDIAS